MFGILNLNKPIGCTSRDAVNRVQRLIRPVKVGHAGTLDPLAEGVLVLCLGAATRLIEKVQEFPKSYRGTFRLGCHSPTDDMEGEIVTESEPIVPSFQEIQQAMESWVGIVQQTPPAYSAIKIKGKRAYHLARQGKTFALAPRPITIHSLSLVRYQYPDLTLDIRCSRGTYIRSLGRDLAAAVGTRAVMTALTRTAVGPFSLTDSIDPQMLTRESLAQQLQSPLNALGSMPQVQLSTEQVTEIRHGRLIFLSMPLGESGQQHQPPAEVAALDSCNRLVALLTPKTGNRWGPKRNFNPS